jgi:hypothetical protein
MTTKCPDPDPEPYGNRWGSWIRIRNSGLRIHVIVSERINYGSATLALTGCQLVSFCILFIVRISIDHRFCIDS